MPDWFLYLLFVVITMGATIGIQRFLPPPKKANPAPQLKLGPSFHGTVVDGQMSWSPGQVPCLGYGVVFARMEGREHREFVVLHRGGWTDGFEIRTKEGEIVAVPKGCIHMDGDWAEMFGRAGASTYLAAAELPDDAIHTILTTHTRILELHVELNANVTVHATRFDARSEAAAHAQPPQGDAYRQAPRKHVAQGHILVRVAS